MRYIDAPVTGLPSAAAAGELTLLLGAAVEDLQASRVSARVASNRIIHFGPIGTGTAYKLIVNLLGAVQIASAAESMALAGARAWSRPRRRSGCDRLGRAASPQVVRTTRRIVEGNHDRDVVFTPTLRLKDVRYALGWRPKLGIGSPFSALASSAFQELIDRGDGQANERRLSK